MSKYVIDSATLISIGDAVREKEGTTDTILVKDLASRISAIETGGGGEELPEEAFNVSGNCKYKFAYGGWNWFLNNYGRKIKTSNINDCSYMFVSNTSIETIPFDINVSSNGFDGSLSSMFMSCSNLKQLPLIKGTLKTPTSTYTNCPSFANMFAGCANLREIPYDYFNNFGGDEFWEATQKLDPNRNNIFQNCYSLRKLPDVSRVGGTIAASYNYSASMYAYMCTDCYCLDEITDFPVLNLEKTTNNCFMDTFDACDRLQRLTFKTNEDGSPLVGKMTKQVIDLASVVGYSNQAQDRHVPYYNSGITTAKKVVDDATYQALKNDEDWYTLDINYSRYNHDSAVETINSLPDCSAFVAEKGNPNTIKFKGASGALTDGGAINTLTEEEIAVAAAKGWTVTLSQRRLI